MVVPLLTTERAWIGGAGFLGLLLIENIRPFRRPVEARVRRYLTNLFIAGANTLLLTVLLGGLLIATYQRIEMHRVGLLHRLGISGWWNVALTLVFLDGATYAWHMAYHRVPAMWRLHRAHHSDLDLDVTTSGRFHLFEMILSALFRLVVLAVWGADVASVVCFEIVFGFFNQLEHANVQLPERLDAGLRWVVVTPAMHRVHHSQVKTETNSNFGTIFSWWDRWCGTYRFRADQQRLIIGLPEYPSPDDVVLGHVLALPFGPPCELAETGASVAS